jgi:hypothetical protein
MFLQVGLEFGAGFAIECHRAQIRNVDGSQKIFSHTIIPRGIILPELSKASSKG